MVSVPKYITLFFPSMEHSSVLWGLCWLQLKLLVCTRTFVFIPSFCCSYVDGLSRSGGASTEGAVDGTVVRVTSTLLWCTERHKASLLALELVTGHCVL